MPPPKNKPLLRPLLVCLAVSVLMLVAGLWLVPEVSARQIGSRLLWPLTRLLIFITLGLVLGQVIEASGWTRAVAVVARPLFRFGNLGDQCSAAFTTAFFSGVTANAMLLDFYREGTISRRQLFLSNFVNQLPAYFLHLPTTFFIVIPLTGKAGGLYFLLTFGATVLRTAMFLLYGHLGLQKPAASARTASGRKAGGRKKDWAAIVKTVKDRLPRRLARIAVYVIPIYTAVFMANVAGLFQLMRQALAGYVVTTFMPMESLSVIILSFAAEFTSGFAAAGALLDAGMLSVKQTVLALLIGNILAFPIRALRHQLPRYIGIFAPKMGTQLLLLGQGFRIISIMFMGFVYYFAG